MSIIIFMSPTPKRQSAREKNSGNLGDCICISIFWIFFSFPPIRRKRGKSRAWNLFWSGGKCRTPTLAPHGPSQGPQWRRKRPAAVASDGGSTGEGGGDNSFFHIPIGFPWLSLVRPPTPETGSLNEYTCSARYTGPCAQRYIKEQSVKSLRLCWEHPGLPNHPARSLLKY